MTKDQILARLRDTQVDIIVHTRVYEQHKQAFETACFIGDGVSAQEHRDAVHAATDRILDATSSVMALSRQLIHAQ